MAQITDERGVTVFKFPETGVVALCHEVVQFIADKQPERYGLDVSKAYYSVDEQHGYLQVTFPNIVKETT